jgi:hypothetical protein
MTHYLDLGFLLCLVTKTSGSRAAWDVVRSLPQPLPITSFQALQAENGLRKRMLGQDAKLQAVAAQAWALWQFYLREMVFVLMPAPWDAAMALARSWNERTPKEPPARNGAHRLVDRQRFHRGLQRFAIGRTGVGTRDLRPRFESCQWVPTNERMNV